MKSKKEIIFHLQKARRCLSQVIVMAEQDFKCLEIHKLLERIIHQLEKTKKDLLNQHLEKSVDQFYKHNPQGKSARQEIISFFHT